jgi:mRNA interferase YafQ
MNNYKYDVVYSTKFKKSLKKIKKQNKNIDELLDVIDKLALKEELDKKYRNHRLIDDKYYKNCSECHIRPDWLLIYQYNDNELLLLLINTGSHSELFGK